MTDEYRTPDRVLIGLQLAAYAGPVDEAPQTARASEERANPEPEGTQP